MTEISLTAHQQTPYLKRLGLWLLILVHIISGAITLSLIFPFSKPEVKRIHIQKWSQRLLTIFGIELEIKNQSALIDKPYLLASNHISWMDIHVINAFRPIRFVAKSEVASWPIFGWMAKHLGTVFIQRGSSRHAHYVVGEMSQVLKSESICIFPEGTSTEGRDVRPFKPNLFESAIVSGAPVYSLAIRYISSIDGRRSEVAAFVGEMGLLESMSNMLKHRNLIVQLNFFPPAGSSPQLPTDRKWLALHSQETISNYIAENP